MKYRMRDSQRLPIVKFFENALGFSGQVTALQLSRSTEGRVWNFLTGVTKTRSHPQGPVCIKFWPKGHPGLVLNNTDYVVRYGSGRYSVLSKSEFDTLFEPI